MALSEDRVESSDSQSTSLSSDREVGGPSGLITNRDGHVQVALLIRVLGLDVQGRHFDETGRTSTISWCGGSIILNRKLEIDQELIICCLEHNKEAEIRVVGRSVSRAKNSFMGFHCLTLRRTTGISSLRHRLILMKMASQPAHRTSASVIESRPRHQQQSAKWACPKKLLCVRTCHVTDLVSEAASITWKALGLQLQPPK